MNVETEQHVRTLYRGIDSILAEKQHFTCVYGSVITEQNNPKSDIDFFVTSKIFSNQERTALTEFAKQLHRRLEITLDEEVPYENKIALTNHELLLSVHLKGLTIQEGRIMIPPIVKSPEFLSSVAVRYRLAFNALTVPHDVNQNTFLYRRAKTRAEESLFLLAADLADQRGLNPGKIINLIDVLMTDGQGNTGEMYLGYKPYEQVLRHLTEILERERDKFTFASEIQMHTILFNISEL